MFDARWPVAAAAGSWAHSVDDVTLFDRVAEVAAGPEVADETKETSKGDADAVGGAEAAAKVGPAEVASAASAEAKDRDGSTTNGAGVRRTASFTSIDDDEEEEEIGDGDNNEGLDKAPLEDASRSAVEDASCSEAEDAPRSTDVPFV